MPGLYRHLVRQISASNGRAMLIYGAIHGLAVALGHVIAEPRGSYSGVWPAVGVLAAFLIITPTSRWMAMLAAAVLVEGLAELVRFWPAYATTLEMLWEFPYASIDALTATFSAVVYRRLCGQLPPDSRTALLALLAILGVLLVGAILGTTWLRVTDDTPWLPSLWNWFITNLLGALAAGVPLLTWWFREQGHAMESAGSPLELAAITVIALALAELTFAYDSFSPNFHLTYLLFPLTLWAAIRFDPTWALSLTAVLTMHLMFLANHVRETQSLLDAQVYPQALLPLQLFLVMLLTTTMMLSVALNELRALNRRLLDVSRQVSAKQLAARQRFAAELQNGVDAALARIEDLLRDAPATTSDASVTESLSECSQLVRDMRQSVRGVADDLTLESLGAQGLGTALQQTIDRMRSRHGLNVSLDARIPPRTITPSRAAIVTRVVHELLLNVAKHSGAQEATVTVREYSGDVEVEVRDSGRGFDTATVGQTDARGFGLVSIRDQVEFEGGSCDIDSSPGAGCRVRVRFALAD
jgi:signal transduction histidine kinase